MNPKQRKKLKKMIKTRQKAQPSGYIQQLTTYATLFDDFPSVKYLINNVIESDRLLKNGLLPQPLPKLLLPDDIQDIIFQFVNHKYPAGDPQGDQLWNQYTTALPEVDRLLRNYREYLETTYGMWAYISAPVISDLAHYINHAPVLEVMAGNGYISKGLRNLSQTQTIYTTDSQSWTAENETGKHPVTTIEPLDALAALRKYGDQVQFVIMSWAPDKQTTDWELLQMIRADYPDITLITLGEQNGATNSHEFWENAQFIDPEATQRLNRNFAPFDLVNEHLFLVK